jgi:hypothetical protein
MSYELIECAVGVPEFENSPRPRQVNPFFVAGQFELQNGAVPSQNWIQPAEACWTDARRVIAS